MHFVLKPFPQGARGISPQGGKIGEDNELPFVKTALLDTDGVDSEADTTDEGLSTTASTWKSTRLSAWKGDDESFAMSPSGFGASVSPIIDAASSADMVSWTGAGHRRLSHPSTATENLGSWSRMRDEEGPPPGLIAKPEVAAESDQQAHSNQGVPSVGSASHPHGCSPCAWFWKAQGCQNGVECRRCHLCPEGELKARKKSKVAALRANKPVSIDVEDSGVNTPRVAEPAMIATSTSLTPASKDAAPAKVELPPEATQSSGEGPPVSGQSNSAVDLPSKGAMLHPSQCRPCAWFWKPQGCNNGKDCGHCHACPDGELKSRRKAKLACLRMDNISPSHKRDGNTSIDEAFEGMHIETPVGKTGSAPLPVDQAFASPLGSHQPTLNISVESPGQQGGAVPHMMSPMSPMSPSALFLSSMLMPPVAPLPSVGSAMHGTGKCKPCAWFWKPRGCLNGQDCGHCHMCPDGEIKSRRMEKVQAMRLGALVPAKGGSAARKLKIAPLL